MSEPINDGGPAFPCPNPSALDDGISLRDWFAGQIVVKFVEPLLAEGLSSGGWTRKGQLRQWSSDAYAIADAMLAEREKRKT